MNRLLCIFALLLIIGCDRSQPPATQTNQPVASENQPQSLETIEMSLNGTVFTIQVANEDHEREKGYMFRKSIPDNEGMLFVFPYEAPRGFWMKNVPTDLDIAYLDAQCRIVSTHTMRAYSTRSTYSLKDAKFALELRAGRIGELGLVVGQVLDIPANVRDSAR
jgi:uncharacterized membrane protein (UPF0127 family)